MAIKIYNSLTRKKEEFVPHNSPKVNIYTCGVTVYDESHIGHARSLYIFEVIRKYLQYRGYKVNFVRNITDIDDKIINRAKELKVDWKELIKKYIDKYYEDLKLLGIEKGDKEPRATENIPDMVKYIQRLIAKGYAYEAGGDVYFSVRKFPNYGQLSGQSIDQMETGVRIDPTEHKKDPLDFALWKSAKEGEPFWNSPWGKGRPGWHIECSVMSQKFLKTDTLDIHAGGRDLIFPHHENEIAQAEALTDKPFAKYWLHHGLLTINGQKMAKSLGNFVTIKDFMERNQDIDYLKLLFLSTQYRHPVDYSEEKITEMKKEKERMQILINAIYKKLSVINHQPLAKKNNQLEGIKEKFLEAMDDDFNMPQALAALFELINNTNKHIDDVDFIYSAFMILIEFLNIFDLLPQKKVRVTKKLKDVLESLLFLLADQRGSVLIKEEDIIKARIRERDKARRDKNYTLADKIRKEMESEGIILEDTKEGTTWRRKI